ncbi:hypothetical protein JXA34_00155 [Patescibacteria group bacterium]|nr:hypothetical protein [Patescibacteria group bacterium]
MDFIRINCSYGDKNQYNTILKNLDDARKTKDISVLLDIKKLEHLQYAKDNNLKYIALSFAEYEEQITRVRNILEDAIVISKIESNIGVENFNSILEKSDGIMVARGDLGEAVSLEKVPPLQKDFTIKTLRQNKFLVTATEMLLSMINNPTPTRAEVSDVANAVFDFSSAVMLSEETTIGKYPVESVSYMRKIIGEAEEWNESNKKKP